MLIFPQITHQTLQVYLEHLSCFYVLREAGLMPLACDLSGLGITMIRRAKVPLLLKDAGESLGPPDQNILYHATLSSIPLAQVRRLGHCLLPGISRLVAQKTLSRLQAIQQNKSSSSQEHMMHFICLNKPSTKRASLWGKKKVGGRCIIA
jgi:hypothetical protein